MKKFDSIIIGFGKAGKTLAGTLAAQGQQVALIERSEKMYGGTCINVACIPTKFLENNARLSNAQGGDFAARSVRYAQTIEGKRKLTAMLREKNYAKVVGSGAQVINGTAKFEDKHHLTVQMADGSSETLYGEKIFINTGAVPFIPSIPGLQGSKFVLTSEAMLELTQLPLRLVIIGGGYIGLEFASYFANFGSQVTIVQDTAEFVPREDAEIAQTVLDSLTARKVQIIRSAKIQSIQDLADHAEVTVETSDGVRVLPAEAVLIATGRRPNVDGLNLAAAGVELTQRGAIATNEKLQTTADNIWAMGDVVGGLQFTYISLDDFRIVKDTLLGKGQRTVHNRGAIPYSVFLDPPLSRVGLTEAEAQAQGYRFKVVKLAGAAIPKAQVLKQPTGMLKAIVDSDTNLILGAHFFCAESHEMINLIKLAMDAKIPYTALRDGIFNHPTMSEALNDLFAGI